jgi:hypothetical protein
MVPLAHTKFAEGVISYQQTMLVLPTGVLRTLTKNYDSVCLFF